MRGGARNASKNPLGRPGKSPSSRAMDNYRRVLLVSVHSPKYSLGTSRSPAGEHQKTSSEEDHQGSTLRFKASGWRQLTGTQTKEKRQ